MFPSIHSGTGVLEQVKCPLSILDFYYLDVICKYRCLILFLCILRICIIVKLWNLGSGNKDKSINQSINQSMYNSLITGSTTTG